MEQNVHSAPHSKAAYRRWLVAYALLNALVATGISLSLGNWHQALLPNLYLGGAMLINFVMWSLLLSLPLALLPFLSIPGKTARIISALVYTLALLLVLINVRVYGLYHFHLNGMVLNLIFSGALMENLAFSTRMWLSASAASLLIPLGTLLLYRLSSGWAAKPAWRPGRAIGTAIFAIITLQIFTGTAEAFGWKSYTNQHPYIPWMQVTTMRSSLKKMGFSLPERQQVDLAQGGNLHYPLNPLQCQGDTNSQYNIVMLIVDSLRADMLAADIMPFTYQLAQQGRNYTNHYSNANATRYGMFSLFYGLPGNYWKPMLASEQGSPLFDQTLAHNYQHFIYGSSKLTFPEFDRTIFSRLRTQLRKGAHKNSAANDRDINDRFIQDLQQLKPQQRFFGMLFYDAPHAFSLPENFPSPFSPMLQQVNYMELDNDYDPTPFLNRYKATALYVDGLIAAVYQQLQQQGLLDNTILVITSDHGQEFNETRKNFWGHNSNFSLWQTQVPMLILWPGQAPAQINSLTSHEDLLPSLLRNGFGCTNPISDYSTGQDLLGPLPQERSLLFESWTDTAILYNQHLFIINHYGDIDALDLNYRPLAHQEIPPQLLIENLERMSRFIKRDP